MSTVATAALVDRPLRELLPLPHDDDSRPGSGFAAAATGALAAAVVAMAAERSPLWDQAGGAVAQARTLGERAVTLAEQDASAYARAERALAAARADVADRHELYAALDEAAEIPLRIAALGADVVSLAVDTAAACADDVRADAAAAAMLAAGATGAATLLVEVNLLSGADDPRVAAARAYAAEATELARTVADTPGLRPL